jgi:hypothetical protein
VLHAVAVSMYTPHPNTADKGGSTMYQTPGNAQITARTGLAARQATKPLYPSLVGTTPDTGGLTVYQTPGHARSPLSRGQQRRAPPSRLRSSRYPIFPGHDGLGPAIQVTDASVHAPQWQFVQIGDSDVASDLRS